METENKQQNATNNESLSAYPREISFRQAENSSDSELKPEYKLRDQIAPPEEDLYINSDTPDVRYAGFWIRLIASLIDGLVLLIPCTLVSYLTNTSSGVIAVPDMVLPVLGVLLCLMVSWIYMAVMLKTTQATIGKLAVGIRVVSDKTDSLTFGQIMMRETLGKIASGLLFGIGYIIIGFTHRKQGLHDMMSSTVVIHKDANKKRDWWVAVVTLLVVGGVAAIFFVLFFPKVESRINEAKVRAQDANVREALKQTLPMMVKYKEETKSYRGFRATLNSKNSKLIACSGAPVFNVSADGESVAVFMRSCEETTKFYCVDSEGNNTPAAKLDESYVLKGNALCLESSTPEIVQDELAVEPEPKPEPPADNAPMPEQPLIVDQPTVETPDSVSPLPNIFQDSVIGFSVRYPDNWKFKKEQIDGKTVLVEFEPQGVASPSNVWIQTITLPQEITDKDITDYIASSKDLVTGHKGKIYDEKDFVYDLESGTQLVGKAFKAEYAVKEIMIKQWVITIPFKNKLYNWMYTSQLSSYDQNYQPALDMLKSWKIEQKSNDQ